MYKTNLYKTVNDFAFEFDHKSIRYYIKANNNTLYLENEDWPYLTRDQDNTYKCDFHLSNVFGRY